MLLDPATVPSFWRPIALAVFLAFVLALTACGGGDSDDDGGEPNGGGNSSASGNAPASAPASRNSSDPDPCVLLTEVDVQALLGTVPAADKTPVGPFKTCAYYATLTNFVQLQVCNCLHGDQFDDSVESGADFLEVEAEPVSDVGDKAFWLEGILWVQEGDIAFNLWLSTRESYAPDGTALEGDALQLAALPKTRALALRIIDRLD